MDRVNFDDNEVAEQVDMNDLGLLPHDYAKQIVRAYGNNKSSFLFNNLPPTGIAAVVNDVTFDVPEQQFAAAGGVQTYSSVGDGFSNNTGGARRYWIFFLLVEEEIAGTRTIVNPGTGVETPTPGTVIRTIEKSLLEVVETLPAALQPTPTGGALGPTETLIGSILYGHIDFTGGDGPPAFNPNTAGLLVLPGSPSTTLPHAATHVDEGAATDLIPFPTPVNRGAMPRNSLPYLSNALVSVIPNTNEPFAITLDQANDFPGTPFSVATGRRARMTLQVGSGFSKAGGVLNHDFGTPGVDANKPARAIDVVAPSGTPFTVMNGGVILHPSGSLLLSIAHGLGVIPRFIHIEVKRKIGTGLRTSTGQSFGTSQAAHIASQHYVGDISTPTTAQQYGDTGSIIHPLALKTGSTLAALTTVDVTDFIVTHDVNSAVYVLWRAMA